MELHHELDALVDRHWDLRSVEPRLRPEEKSAQARHREEARSLLAREARGIFEALPGALEERGFHVSFRDDMHGPVPFLELNLVTPPSTRRGRCRACGTLMVRCHDTLRYVSILSVVWGRRGERDDMVCIPWDSLTAAGVRQRILSFLDRLLTEC